MIMNAGIMQMTDAAQLTAASSWAADMAWTGMAVVRDVHLPSNENGSCSHGFGMVD
jgi:hypothetical protein